MKRIFLAMVLFAAVGVCFAQSEKELSDVKTILLQNSIDTSGPKPVFRRELYHKSCLNLFTLDHGCRATPGIHFGTQIGVNVNIFQVNGGRDFRTRMVLIGNHNWGDKFIVPLVTPWEALGPGDVRTISVNASGADGARGARGSDGGRSVAGMNGDGTYSPTVSASTAPPSEQLAPGPRSKDYASAPISEQVSSTIKGTDGQVRKDSYTPYVDAKQGYMYAVHVVEGEKDYYVLIRVEEIVDGKQIKLSYLKLDLPPVL
jgi:hypothetical protein